MASIDYYFSTISPWAYFAGDRLEQISAQHGATITYKPLDLMQLFDRTGGVRRENRHPNRLAFRDQELTRWAEYLGVPFLLNPPFGRVNTAPSSYAIIAAQAEGGGDLPGLIRGTLAAHFAEGRDISEDETIRDLLGAHGFDPALADKGLFVGAETYGRNLEQAIEAGVFGVPFYIVRETDQRFWGQDRLDFLDRHLATL
ncbi:2-hydroxychromene-2-carboxylate isomerase [Paracoccus caeni]|uniref:2-hydroxychromene-2-carboxylate isomerase n=1 Tax=Paracoccus caeni TaxID=657651 RepID=A0A934SM62_9RHOB|nr:2-hydroxychromene-2-carboxylate isomerase [Paracoccus caeni]MBK4217762.1 2-hydroxychromene-2-carboxylate isomerase [Paracoccus caeni]